MKCVDYVNVRLGTGSVPSYSNGNILPITGRPFGMTSFALETRGNTHTLFYHPDDHTTTGIRLTHCPSPWIDDYGNFTMMAQSGDLTGRRVDAARASGFRQRDTQMTPYYLSVRFLQYRSVMELVPTARGAAVRLHYDRTDATQRFTLVNTSKEAQITVDPVLRRVSGYTRANTGSVPENFAQYFVFEFDRDFDMQKTFLVGENAQELGSEKTHCQNGLSLNLAFASDGQSDASVRMATSFISMEQAELNLKAEVLGKTFDGILEEAKQEWESYLAKIEIEADEEQKKTFYSCFYRMLLFPRIFFEYDETGAQKHYSPANGKICDGPMYTDNGFWDTYKTVYPLFSLILSDRYEEMCRAFVNFYEEAGWLPRWLSLGAVNCMPGTAIDAVFGDAVAKKVVTDSSVIEKMLEGTLKHAEQPSDHDEFGREGLEDYLSLGYVTSPHRESINKTLDYSYGDFCIAVMAKALGKTDVYDRMTVRAFNYRNIFDPTTGFMRARDAQGNMRSDWTQFDWGGDYCEGGPWQNSFAVYQDFFGLAKAMGGRSAFEKKLDELFATPPYYRPYGYPFEIHEMTEMAAVDFGQCALSNQPSFHIPYLYSCNGNQDKTAYWVRKAAKELFSATPDGLPGDEDNGSMSGWYVFSSLGFYPVCPGVNQYVLGSPAVRRAVLHLDNGKTLEINAPENSDKTVYVSAVEKNKTPVDKVYLTQEQLKSGGELDFFMSEKPSGRVFTDEQLPFSLSR